MVSIFGKNEKPHRHFVRIVSWSGMGPNGPEMSILGTLFALFLGQAWDQMGQKSQYVAINANFEPNLAAFEPILHLFGGRE